MSQTKNDSYPIRSRITCPHCWSIFPVENILWISEAPDLMGDSRLGESDKERFLPVQFDLAGNAMDRRGFHCKKLACPYCHLQIPRSFLETDSFFISIAGAPGSGKSYFLTAMTWNLRKTFPSNFSMMFSDADPEMNARLLDYETSQFMNDDESATVKIEKTQEQGDLYNSVLVNNQNITYLQPFLFSLTPTSDHPNLENRSQISLSLSLYDNAGESYLPMRDSDSASLPVTRHLGKSHCIFFIYDLIQDSRFRSLCRNESNDPQLQKDTFEAFTRSPLRQEMVLSEVIKRTRSEMGLLSRDKYPYPFIVVVTKYDAWKELMPTFRERSPWARAFKSQKIIFLDNMVQMASSTLRSLLKKVLPEMVTQIEDFASNVTYIPVSATGGPPVFNEKTQEWGFRVNNLKSIWVEVPLLYAISQTTHGIIQHEK